MSMYDNFRAPQYVDFLNLQNGDNGADNASAFFNSSLEMDSSLKLKHTENSRLSSFSSMSDNEKTLTPTACNTPYQGGSNTTLTPSPSMFCETAHSSMDVTPQTASYCASSPQNTKTPFRSALNKSRGRSVKLDLSSKKVNWQQPSEESNKFREANKRENAHEDKKSLETSSVSENTPGACNPSKLYSMLVTVNVIPPTPSSPGCALGTSTPLVSSAVSKQRENEKTSNRKRRSRSAGPAEPSLHNEEILLNALETLNLNGKKTGITSISESLRQSISPQALSNHSSSKKTTSNNRLEEGTQRNKRKLSPASRLIRDSCQQPEKFISMAEQIARLQKNTPDRFRTLPKSANLRQAVKSKIAKNIRFQHKVSSTTKKLAGSNDGPGATGNPELEKIKSTVGEKGVRVPKVAPSKVQPFQFTENKGIPKTIFNFDQKENLLLRDRRTPLKRLIPTTKVQPFSFDKRDQEIIKRKVERLKGVAGTDVPCGKPVARQRSKSHSGEMLVKEQTHHARVPVVLYKPPFQPQPSHHRPTVPIPVTLSTERRAKEREEYEGYLRQKEQQRSALLNKFEEKKKEEEKKDIQQLRKDLVHKAKPVPKFVHKFKVKPSNAPLTSPHSPSFVHRPPIKPLQKPDVKDDDPMDC